MMGNPFVYYRIDSIRELNRNASCPVRELDWHKDLAVIQRFYARFTDTPVNPDEFDQTVGNPLAVMKDEEIVSFAIPLSFRDSETEIGGVATVPEQRNKGLSKALISEMASRILNSGKAMRAAAAAIGMREL